MKVMDGKSEYYASSPFLTFITVITSITFIT